MADDLKRVGLVFKADGTQEFKASMKEINAAMQQNRSELKLAKSAYDENTTSTKKLMDEQKYLTSQTQAYAQKVGILQEELNQLENAENRDEVAIKKKKTQLNNTQTTLNNYKNSLANVETQLKNGSAQMESYEKQLDKTNTSIKENETNFKLAQSEWTKSTSVTQKLKDEQKYLSDQTQAYTEKQKLLKSELETLNSAEEKNEQAIREKKQQLAETETALNNYKIRLEETEAKLKSGSEQLEIYASKLQNIGGKATDTGKKMSTAVTAPLTGVAVAGVTLATNFESAMSKVESISGATGEELEKLKVTAQEYGKTTQFSATDCANAMQYMALAGWDTSQMVENLGGVLNLAASADMDLAEASDIVTDYLSAFNKSQISSTKLADEMAFAQANSNTSVEQLSEAYKNCAANMNANGQSIETTTAILSKMADQGYKGAEAGTSLTAIMRDLTNSMEDGSIEINEHTIKVQDANGNFRNMIDIMNDVESSVNGMGDAERAAALSAVFTSDSIKGVNYILSTGTESVSAFADELKVCDGTASDMARIMNDNFAGQLKTLQSELENVGIQIGEIIVPHLSKLLDHVSDLLTRFSGLDDEQKKIIITIAGVVAAIGPMLIIFGSMANGLGSIISLISTIRGFGLIGKIGGIASSLSGGIGSAISGIKTASIGLISTVKGFGIGTKIASLGSTIEKVLVGAISGIKTAATGLFSVIAANPVIAIIAAIVIAVVALYAKCEWFRDGVNAIFGTIGGFLSGAVSTAKQKLGEMKAAYEENGGGIKGVVAAAMTGIEGIFSDTYQIINNLTGGKLEECKTAIQSKLTDAKNICSEKLGEMKTAYEENGGGIKGAMAAAMTGVKSIVSTQFSAINTLTGGKLGEMLSTAENKLNDLRQKFTNKISDIKQTVSDGVNKLKGFFDFDWSLPKIKMPHFKINGGFSLDPPKVPSFDVSWYANGGILNRPTIFGAASNGRLLGGGEAGKEAVAPLDTLLSYIRTENSESNEQLISSLSDVMSNAVYTALIKAIQTLKPEIILDDEKVGDFVLELLRKEVFT